MLKKLLLILFCLICCSSLYSYDTEVSTIVSQNPDVCFRLFPTKNMWTFLQLNTITGQIDQLHFDIQGESRGLFVLNDKNLAKDMKVMKGRFTLYPTQNMYNFILLDQDNGRSWQIQWSFDKENRLVIPIY